MRISDWSSDVCSSDLLAEGDHRHAAEQQSDEPFLQPIHDSGEHERAPETARAAEARRHPAPSPQRGRCRSLCLMEGQLPWFEAFDRKRVVSGKRVPVRVDLGVRRIIKKNNT